MLSTKYKHELKPMPRANPLEGEKENATKNDASLSNPRNVGLYYQRPKRG
jgi:hypothetical protein